MRPRDHRLNLSVLDLSTRLGVQRRDELRAAPPVELTRPSLWVVGRDHVGRALIAAGGALIVRPDAARRRIAG